MALTVFFAAFNYVSADAARSHDTEKDFKLFIKEAFVGVKMSLLNRHNYDG
jgi:hypothetical protein